MFFRKKKKEESEKEEYRIIKAGDKYLAQFFIDYSNPWVTIQTGGGCYRLDTWENEVIIEKYKDDFYTTKEKCEQTIKEHNIKRDFEEQSRKIHNEKYISNEPIETIEVKIYERVVDEN